VFSVPKIVITDAKMQMLHSVWNEIIAFGEIMDNVLVTPHLAYYTEEADNRLDREYLYSARRILNNDTLENVKNGDILESMGKIVNRLPYGELPYTLDE
jgi:hypothetical protein